MMMVLVGLLCVSWFGIVLGDLFIDGLSVVLSVLLVVDVNWGLSIL